MFGVGGRVTSPTTFGPNAPNRQSSGVVSIIGSNW